MRVFLLIFNHRLHGGACSAEMGAPALLGSRGAPQSSQHRRTMRRELRIEFVLSI